MDPPINPFAPPHATGFGAAYGTAKAGVGIASMGVLRPDLVIKSIIPVVMAGVLGIYGLIIAVIISTGSEWDSVGQDDGQEVALPVGDLEPLSAAPLLTHSPVSNGCSQPDG